MSLNSYWRRVLENYVYSIPEPPPRERTKPMQVLCVGPSRSATESLQQALLTLGYDYTHHGWDIVFEKPNRARGWNRLARRKWLNEAPGLPITAKDFDELLGHAVAVTDTAANCFAGELIQAYPEAKVVLNVRRDLDAWMESMERSFLKSSRSPVLRYLPYFDSNFWWISRTSSELLYAGFFRFINGQETFTEAVRARGKLVYKEHCDMVRGMVPPEQLLEWGAEDGWEPLCKFLGKDIPDEPFPYVNTNSAGWKEREAQWGLELARPALKNLGITMAVVAASIATAVYYFS